MLESFYIIDNTGIGIYEYHYKRSKRAKIEFQLLAGLITALIEFSQTTLMDNIQVIKLMQAKLVFTADSKYPKFYAIGLYDISDHDHVIKKANKKIFSDFNTTYYDRIKDPSIADLEQLNEYEPYKSLKYRNLVPMLLPLNWIYLIIVTLVSIVAMFLAYLVSPNIFLRVIKEGFPDMKTYYLSFVIYGIPYAISGFFSGKRLYGFIVASAINTILTTIFVFLLKEPLTSLRLEGLDFTYVLAMICGFFGGYLSEFFFLNKLVSRNKSKKAKAQ